MSGEKWVKWGDSHRDFLLGQFASGAANPELNDTAEINEYLVQEQAKGNLLNINPSRFAGNFRNSVKSYNQGVVRDNAREASGEMPPNAGGGGAQSNGKSCLSVDCFLHWTF
jgi:hypothetical protein